MLEKGVVFVALGTALTSADAKLMLNGALSALCANIDAINALNVFPVPDGDTGTNMYHTFSAAVQEAEKVKDDSVGKILDAAAFGSLMGARGNSGVILSQLLRGLVTRFKTQKELSCSDLILALTDAINTAYNAVMKPVEGTMLTVARDAAKAGIQAIRSDKELMEIFEAMLVEAKVALERTPMQLPVLKKAGVVDAGGRGIVVLLEGAIDAVKNGLSEDYVPPVQQKVESGVAEVYVKAEQELVVLDMKYCTEFLLKGTDLVVDRIREDLDSMGNSLLVVGTNDLVKIHIHTNNPGLILEYSIALGELSDIKIDNMSEQHNQAWGDSNNEAGNSDNPGNLDNINSNTLGVVVVAAGAGITQIFRELGADEIVQGGQTMNPSIEDLAKAVERVKAKNVIILPNNKNVILTVQQVKTISQKNIDVLPSKSVVEGIAALLRIDKNVDMASNMELLTEALDYVKTGEVTFAVRDWESDDMIVNEKDCIGLYNNELKVVGKDLGKVVNELLDHMVSENDEVITLYYGEDVSEEQSMELCRQIQDKYSWCEVEMYFGGQPLYYYLISVE